MAELHGFCDERFSALEVAFCAGFDSGVEKGASLAATLHGEPVVDLWAGTRDHEQATPWEADTLVRVFSSSKPMVATTVLMLVDRGLLDVDAPIAEYWPEFARHGKGSITAKHVLVHNSGVPGFGRRIGFDDFADWEHMIGLVEDAQLWYEPGTITCYHPHTYGFILGEVVRRVTGVPFAEFFRRELTEPLGAEFHFGLTDPADHARVAALWPPPEVPEVGTPMGMAVMGEPTFTTEWFMPEFMPVVLPSGSGITHARGMARLGSMLAMGGEVDGRRYLDRSTIEWATQVHNDAVDEVLGPIRYGLGFGLDSPDFPAPTPTTFHWGGYGGSFISVDMASGVSCAYTPNQLIIGDTYGADPRLELLWAALGDVSRGLT